MDDWETIVDFTLVEDANAKWELWLQSHDISELAATDILIDTGSGEIGSHRRDVRRYRIRKSSIPKIKLKSSREH